MIFLIVVFSNGISKSVTAQSNSLLNKLVIAVDVTLRNVSIGVIVDSVVGIFLSKKEAFMCPFLEVDSELLKENVIYKIFSLYGNFSSYP